MIEPCLALRTAVRATLVNDSAVTTLVPPERIRSGSTRPDGGSCVVIAGEQTMFLGRPSRNQFLARCFLDLHIWAPDGSGDLAQLIGGAVAGALFDAPGSAEIAIDEYQKPQIRYFRDPAPERAWTHGHAELEAVVRWGI